MLDLTAYKFQCLDCLGQKLVDEKAARDLAISTWEATNGVAVADRAALTQEELELLPPIPAFERELDDHVLHAELEPFVPGPDCLVEKDESGTSRVFCSGCGAVLLTHSERIP